MSQEDYELVCTVRDGDVERDWNEIPADKGSEKNSGETELARFNYYDGKNPQWPEQILRAEYGWALQNIDAIGSDLTIRGSSGAPTIRIANVTLSGS